MCSEMSIADKIKDQQREWARAKPMRLSRTGYSCVRLEDNLFRPMNSDTYDEFKKGDGDELSGKMRALNSSSALACNLFDYWRHGKDASPLAGALGVDEVRDIFFEQKFSAGVRRSFPDLDVVLFCGNETILAVECKFSEPYEVSEKNFIKEAYFPESGKLWEQQDFCRCQDVAEKLRYGYLDAAQLLKHMLGVANSRETGKPIHYKKWSLLYLWFNPGEREAKRHEKEIKRFIGEVSRGGKVGGGGTICEMTYQNLFKSMSENLDDSHKEYREYLTQRYFQ